MIEGNPSSTVKLVYFEDLQCGDCSALRRMIDELLARYGDRVAFEGRDFPKARHECAHAMAAAARYFDEQDPATGAAFRRHMLEEISFITPNSLLVYVSRFAKRHMVSSADAQRSIHDSRYQAMVEADVQEGIRRGVEKTPTVFLNGHVFIETFTLKDLSDSIEEALRRCKNQ